MGPELDAGSQERANEKLTQPLGCAVEAFLLLPAGLLVVGLLAAVSQKGAVWGFGSGSACVDVPLNGLTETGGGSMLAHLRPGTFASTGGQVSLCANAPTFGQRTLVTLTQAPTALLYLAVLLLLWRLLRTISRDGPFAAQVARGLRFLAWFILVGSVAVAIGESVAQSVFASTVVTDSVPVVSNAINSVWDSVSLPVLVACGLLTLARVMRVGTEMSDELAGTV